MVGGIVAGLLKSESRIATDDTDFTDFSVSSGHPLKVISNKGYTRP